jgi:hypothetical protein
MTSRMARLKDPVVLGGLFVFLVTQIVYLLTVTVSSPFWDSGEFIATSYVLGIPHPPGTPLYVLIGKLFTMFPISQISARVNYLSALAASLAAVFTFLVIVKLVRAWWRGRPQSRLDDLIAVGAGITGAFFTAFSRTFWDNAIEAEVYALSSLVMILCVWLVLKWEESGRPDEAGRARPYNNNLLLLIGYLLFVTIGIHMGTFLIGPSILLFVLLISAGTVLNGDLVRAVFWFGVALATFFVITPGLGAPADVGLGLGAIVYIAPLILHRRRVTRRFLRADNLVFWMLALAVVGLSVQLFLLVRARMHPPINEAAPATWQDLWLVLSRDQYKPPNPFEMRQASYAVQFSKHFWRYWHDQYNLGIRPIWLAMMLPFMVGVIGAVGQAFRDRRRFVLMLSLIFMTTVFLVFYLNFKEDEVRDRDYFFVAGYHFFAVWIGLGVATLATWLRGEPRVEEGRLVEPPGGRLFGAGTVAILCALSLLPIGHGWYTHDRTGFLVARDYAYNMLMPLEPNAIVFTNGDNDTFPLWYIQEVEGIRKDVRVVNLSLLNTHWYIRQLRDDPPKVRITVPDDRINMLRGFYTPEGEVVLVKDLMVEHILEVNKDRPIYLAVTVPDQMDLEKRLVMEGLVFRVVAEEGEEERLDVERTWKNLREVFLYRGLLDERGYYDASVYKDDNARKLVQNYVAAYVRCAHYWLRLKEDDKALEALDYAGRINPAFTGVLYTKGYLWLERQEYARAESTFRQLLDVGDRAPETYSFLAQALAGQNRAEEAEQVYREAIRQNPEEFDSYRYLFTFLWGEERKEEAVQLIEGWLESHPQDEQTRRALEELRSPGTVRRPATPPERGAGSGHLPNPQGQPAGGGGTR